MVHRLPARARHYPLRIWATGQMGNPVSYPIPQARLISGIRRFQALPDRARIDRPYYPLLEAPRGRIDTSGMC